ncbi:MAG: glycosyltransferase family 39 protein [Oscillospiraceae bacterium]|nr:glycosyltransferase family 39 protein [Oscillospiraceae bacterium]
MEKASVFFKRIMLGILLAVLGLTLCLVVHEGLTAHSYLLGLALGVLWAAGLYLFLRSRPLPVPKHAVLWAMGLCFVLNLAWVSVIRIEPFSDYEEYWDVACALAKGAEIPDAWYVAMYPHILGTATILSALVRVFGESVFAVTVFNVVLTTLSCGLVWLLGKALISERAAFLAALLWAVTPCKLMLGSLVFSEPIYTLLVLVFFLLFLRLEKHLETKPIPALCLAAGLGLLLEAINLVRPIALILVIAAALWLVFLRGDAEKNARLWAFWLAAFLAMTAVFRVSGTLWDRHVEKVLEQEIASVPWYNVYVGFNEETGGRYADADMDLLTAYLKQGQSAPEAQESMVPHVKERLASGISFPRLFAAKLFSFLGSDQLGGYTYRFTRSERFVKVCMGVCNVFYYGVFLAALAGVPRLLRSRALGAGLLLPLYFLGLTLAHMLVEVSDRYHYSLIPILIIFAALGFAGEERRTQ